LHAGVFYVEGGRLNLPLSDPVVMQIKPVRRAAQWIHPAFFKREGTSPPLNAVHSEARDPNENESTSRTGSSQIRRRRTGSRNPQMPTAQAIAETQTK